MARHTHQYTIADDEAVKVLLDKLLSGGSHQQRREKLLKALDEASQRYSSSRMAKLSERTENARVRGNHRPGQTWVSTRGGRRQSEPFNNVTSVH